MQLGYDVYEDNREFESARVQRYSMTDMMFPCYIVCVSDEKPLKKYTLDILSKMFVRTESYDESVLNSTIHLYFSQGNKTVKFGLIQSSQAKTFLKLFENNDIEGFYDENTALSGDMLYVLAE